MRQRLKVRFDSGGGSTETVMMGSGSAGLVAGWVACDVLTATVICMPLRGTANPPFTQIDMSVKNLSDSAVQVSTSARGARMAITKDGTVVAGAGGVRPVATRYTIEPAAAHHYKSTVNLVGCDTKSALTPGRYQLHALQTFTFLDKDLNRGSTILVSGGPWDIEIRYP